MTQYQLQFHCIPPATLVDMSSNATLSWRNVILDDDSAERIEREHFFCPSSSDAQRGTTSYVAIVEPGFVFDGEKPTSLKSVKDGLSNTILLVEVKNSGISIAGATDLRFAVLVDRFRQRTVSAHDDGFHVLMCDGSVRFLRYDEVDSAGIHAMLTIAGNEPNPIHE